MYKFEDIIEEVNELNTDLRYGLDDIVGVTIEKGLIPTIANLTQTALDKFYIIKPETFVYNPRTHGVRLGMGYNDTCNTYITSWNNVAFRVKNTAQSIVTPQYLWLYFCRPIWDKLTNFLAWGSSTIVFAWKDFLNIEIDLPSIEKQREVVAEYETLSNRIRLNEHMIANLEETAQALYRKMFVDGVDKEHLPEGWRKALFYDAFSCAYGKGLSTEFIEQEGDYPVYGANGVIGYYDKKTISDYAVLITSRGSGSGDILRTFYPEAFVTNNAFVVEALPDYHYCELPFVYNLLLDSNVKQFVSGSAQPQLTNNDLNSFFIVMPPREMVENYCDQTRNLFKYTYLLFEEIAILSKTREYFLSKLS